MTLRDFIEMIEEEGELLSNRNCVLQLCHKDTSEYDRGRIQGQIEMLTKIMTRLVSKDTDDDSITDR